MKEREKRMRENWRVDFQILQSGCRREMRRHAAHVLIALARQHLQAKMANAGRLTVVVLGRIWSERPPSAERKQSTCLRPAKQRLQFANGFRRCLLRSDGVSLWSLGRKRVAAIGLPTSYLFNILVDCYAKRAGQKEEIEIMYRFRRKRKAQEDEVERQIQ